MTYANRLRLACQSVRPIVSAPTSGRTSFQLCHPSVASSFVRAGAMSQSRSVSSPSKKGASRFSQSQDDPEELSSFKRQRYDDLKDVRDVDEPLLEEAYPRLKSSAARKSVPEFLEDFHERLAEEEVNLMGRVRAKRVAGKGLMFLDIVNEFQKAQVMLNKNSVAPEKEGKSQKFALFRNLIQVGDHICKYLL